MPVHEVDSQCSPAAFLAGWTPQRFFSAWIDEVSALGVSPVSAVQTVAVAGSQRRLEWWPAADVEALRHRAQHEGAGLPWSGLQHDGRSGEQQTLEYLIDAAGDAERSAAIMLCASLVARVERARARYPREAWPHFTVAQTLLSWTRAQHAYRWDSGCSATLPLHDSEAGLVLGNMSQLVRFLAGEHARVLHRWTPLQIVASAELRPSVRHSFVSGPEAITFEQHSAPVHSLRAPINWARKRWATIGKQELEALIWSMPQREVAKEFAVSEATVAKRCKALQIVKPERGYWTRPRAPRNRHAAANDNAGRTTRFGQGS